LQYYLGKLDGRRINPPARQLAQPATSLSRPTQRTVRHVRPKPVIKPEPRVR
jgi:hypothetical protein